MQQHTDRQVASWLLICCFAVFLIIVVGGVTRLTHSGLSIVEWQPIIGTVPPMTDVQWQEAFDKYKLTPEYQKVNFGMSIAEFKGIFWWEYVHRLLGRLIGVLFFFPWLYFLVRRKMRGPLIWKLLGIFILGGLQGGMGWFMVKSGLVDDPRVSHYRLTAHLGLAFVIFAAMFWVALDLLLPRTATSKNPRLRGPARAAAGLAALVFVTVLSGGLVAGIRAGAAYNTFPLMNGHIVPPEIFMLAPWHINFFNNMALVQFDHRLLAWLLAFLVPWFWWNTRRIAANPPVNRRARLAASLLFGTLAVQIALGISTLLLLVPIPLAAAHQAGAVLVFTAALFAAHSLRAA